MYVRPCLSAPPEHANKGGSKGNAPSPAPSPAPAPSPPVSVSVIAPTVASAGSGFSYSISTLPEAAPELLARRTVIDELPASSKGDKLGVIGALFALAFGLL